MQRGIDVRHATRREILRKQMELLAAESLKPNKLDSISQTNRWLKN